MCLDMIKLLDDITVTFILTNPYCNLDIYIRGKKRTKQNKKQNRTEKRGGKRKRNNKPFFVDNIVVIILSTAGKREYFCLFI